MCIRDRRIGIEDVIKFTFMNFLGHAAVADEGEVIFEFGITGIAQFFCETQNSRFGNAALLR